MKYIHTAGLKACLEVILDSNAHTIITGHTDDDYRSIALKVSLEYAGLTMIDDGDEETLVVCGITKSIIKFDRYPTDSEPSPLQKLESLGEGAQVLSIIDCKDDLDIALELSLKSRVIFCISYWYGNLIDRILDTTELRIKVEGNIDQLQVTVMSRESIRDYVFNPKHLFLGL